MEIPRFPAAPPTPLTSNAQNHRSVSLDLANRQLQQQQQRRREFARRRPRSASWLVARKPPTRRGRIQPAAAAVQFAFSRAQAVAPTLTTELTLTMTESKCPTNDDDEESNCGGRRLERIRESTSPRTTTEEEHVDEGDVICRATITEGLAWLLTLWAVLGAGAFYITEGPRERQQVIELKDMQRELAIGLATELRQLQTADKEMEPLWSNKVRQYVAKHEKLLLIAVSSGYGEGGNDGHLWTFPGCVLFAISVLTTLGFGAPVPRTTAGRTVAVIFAAIGIPAHFLLILNLGLLFAVRLKRYGIRKRYPDECRDLETIDSMPMPMWVKITPFLAISIYYILGVFCFGVGRLRPFSDSLLFPLDFTAAGGLSTIPGYIRILYGLYLEGAVTIAAIAVAALKVSATQSLTNIGLKYGLLVPA